MEPDPVPVAPLVTVSHDAPGLAVHGQDGCVVIEVVSSLVTLMQALNSIGATEYWQPPVSPACVSSIVRPATTRLPCRSEVAVFRATE